MLGFVVSGFGCASTHVSDLDAYREIPMNRVTPYPSQHELENHAFEIVVVEQPAVGLDGATLAMSRVQVQRGLERIAADAGAAIIDRSSRVVEAIGTEGSRSEHEASGTDAISGAGYALAVHFSTYQYSSTWTKPFKYPWQSPDDVAADPGKCNHLAEVAFEVQVIQIGTDDRVEKTFALEHDAEQMNKDIDPACTLAPLNLSVLFETAIDEALGCLKRPLGALLAPRGHVTAHRKTPEADRHIYRISLGSKAGIQPGDTVEIRREPRAMAPRDGESASGRIMSLGRVTDQISADASWIAIDPSKAAGEILEGDVVRPIKREGLLASLTGPNCASILEQR